MQTFKEIQEDLQNYAASIDLSGVAIDKLCLLLAYSEYKNQILQASDYLEYTFSTSTKLNSRIHHATSLLYSVPRGKCPALKFKTLRVIETKTVSYLDFALLFNGYYFYYANNASYDNKLNALVSEVDLIGTSKPLRTLTVNVTSNLFYADFTGAENVSSDFILYEGSNRVDPSLITESSAEFYSKSENEDDEYVYIYKYLIITIPNYGIRVIRHSDTRGWDESSLTLSYLPYCETLPSLTAMSSIPGFSFVYDSATETYSEIETVPFKERMSDLNQIYTNAISSFLQQGTIATIYDLEVALKKVDSTGNYSIINDVKIEYSEETGYTFDSDSSYTTVVYYGPQERDVTSAISDYKQSFSVTKSIVSVEAISKTVTDSSGGSTFYVEATSPTLTLTTEMLNSITYNYQSNIGGTLDHSDFEADIIKLGFDRVKVYNGTKVGNRWVEATFNVQCQPWEFPILNAVVME